MIVSFLGPPSHASCAAYGTVCTDFSFLHDSLLGIIWARVNVNGRAVPSCDHHGLGSSCDYFPKGKTSIWEKVWGL
ncbi:uncharacterized protein [Gorilla gorilla gorilla]|uniref:uncharacterized protein isoform X3 n=1 Tax=Gorilla gorilla gorilla TaxID=9595 RepID=UPI0030085392